MIKRILYLLGWVVYLPVFIILFFGVTLFLLLYAIVDFIRTGDTENALEWFDKRAFKVVFLY